MTKNPSKIVVTLFVLMLCVPITGANQTNSSDKYTFENYGGEKFTPQPMEFGQNIKSQEKNGLQATIDTGKNATERKHVMLQFYSIPSDEQLELLREYGALRVGVAAEYTYIFSMPASLTPADLPAESGLRWMGEMPVENKYESLNVPEWARTEDGQVKLWLTFYDDVTYEKAQEIANKYSTSAPNFAAYPYEVDCIIITNESNVLHIAGEDSIERVSFSGSEPVMEDDSSVDSKKSPGFSLIFGFLFLLIVFLYLKREGFQ